MLFAFSTLFILTLFSILAQNRTLAGQVNVTIDDTLGAPEIGVHIIYSSARWKNGQTCSDCTSHPDPLQLSTGTWTDASFDEGHRTGILTATVQFTGTAVFVFCAYELSRNMTLAFSIDGMPDPSRNFHQSASGHRNSFQYNLNVYARHDLSNTPHTLTIQNGQPGGGVSNLLLDSIVFTTETVDTSSPEVASRPNSEIVIQTSQSVSSATVTATSLRATISPMSSATSQVDSSSSHTEASTSNATALYNTVAEATGTQITQPSSADASSPGTSSKSTPMRQTLTIIVAVIGTVGGMIIVHALTYLYRRLTRRAAQKRIAQLPVPFDAHGDTRNPPRDCGSLEHDGQADETRAVESSHKSEFFHGRYGAIIP
ncbi:hypothetical protein HGRIS_001888 [Hohenbuehelia grisea]|uniref:Uncharacterized protein n=1 Tax=Hohenbuehelia grisea TaxID=104357 RepID=A0ABR3JKJ6_9AGAR